MAGSLQCSTGFAPAPPIAHSLSPLPPHPTPHTIAGAFDAPSQAAHAHDIGALCSGKARVEALNFPYSDYDQLMPMLASLPHVRCLLACLWSD